MRKLLNKSHPWVFCYPKNPCPKLFLCPSRIPNVLLILMPPRLPSSRKWAKCLCFLLWGGFSWLLNWKVYLLYFVYPTGHPTPKSGIPSQALAQRTFPPFLLTLTMIVNVRLWAYIFPAPPPFLGGSSPGSRHCKIFWHKVNSIFDYYLNRFLSHWPQKCFAMLCLVVVALVLRPTRL